MNRTRLITFAALAALVPFGNVRAQDSGSPQEAPLETTTVEKSEPMDPTLHLGEPDKALIVQFSPYAWITSFSGDMTIKDVEIDGDATFLDIYDRADSVFGLMGAVDVEYDRILFQFNFAWVNAELSHSQSFVDNGHLDADATLNTYWYEWFAGYRILDESMEEDPNSVRRFKLDAFGGLRLTQINLDVDFTARDEITLPDGGSLGVGETVNRRNTKTWLEPFVGARVGVDLSEHWTMSLRGDVGGFGIDGSSFAWQVIAAIGYTWRLDGWTITAGGGYRALGQDYSDGDFGWNEITHGPILGAIFAFAF